MLLSYSIKIFSFTAEVDHGEENKANQGGSEEDDDSEDDDIQITIDQNKIGEAKTSYQVCFATEL